ncbi:RNA pseudouridine synthase 2, chloroplastic [Apostasia shenzhenica]|uniref:RNA pseudouridine synthase 2, chloroplastic n=1 Tax=Apostasia shenzhenica TaxID=1088818 RepID=A0A2I0AZ02_9ASPA|nr:RNA pseudouridine synthase 2, chloroplastic [Apostasia shenzhenica]
MRMNYMTHIVHTIISPKKTLQTCPTMVIVATAVAAAGSPFLFYRRHPRLRVSKFLASCASSSNSSSRRPLPPAGGNFSGIRLEEMVEIGSEKVRIDSWISTRISGVSRARVQSSIRSGLVTVNGRVIHKSKLPPNSVLQASLIIKGGDKICCLISELQPLRAEPEDIPLNIVYEDAHLLVVNKPAHMVVHPAPGNVNGTLVNAILNHCQLPITTCMKRKSFSETEGATDSSDSEIDDFSLDYPLVEESNSSQKEALVRPGIVHRLDKGTSGLLVVAKDEQAHAHLAEQFKRHTIHRAYISMTCGVPSLSSGRIEIPIARDCNNRTRMATVSGSNRHAHYAASRYEAVEIFANGGVALVQWRLETGRTHQIRAHAKYLGIPLMGDELYGGTKGMLLSLLYPRIALDQRGLVFELISKLDRPCLHAQSLGFEHPHTKEYLCFSCDPPDDFAEILQVLRSISNNQTNKRKTGL